MDPLPSLDVFGRSRREGRRLVLVTAYDATGARLAAAGGVDALLVGDSLGQVVLGHGSTLPVTMADMLHHARAVARARTGLPVIVDLPYGAFHLAPRETARNGIRLVQAARAQAVKLEGGRRRADHIAALLDAEIPVMGHLGLTPQSIQRFGGYKVQGRDEPAAERLLEDAQFLAEAGCFALVLECIPAGLAAQVTATVPIPTIGIGAGPDCDGQVLVAHDLLGLSGDFRPRFVKRYAELGQAASAAIASFAAEVRAGTFPTPDHAYGAGRRAEAAAGPDAVSRADAAPGDD
ncbi:MAG TPA: 3-methyl-2-oxobutanoate hydroxymethyltransferase [Candidatus Krumholzibacteria bacterium]|nr:3-methyl-2-oxobutanoate hydroxymethyltransferase [Candidatus Krumholzibacteria bacterium]HPD71764.1 3-methyl-2-oxobutanoate hydroxymethyltransferase [Candidatus Krumholzibacteria bacterium]HRY41303.1 3-methyl-2-oxobutanoate hydroxymethyltransferase [Candidatus Krumholzibacteria bacterium]